jgi:hypothetical protein
MIQFHSCPINVHTKSNQLVLGLHSFYHYGALSWGSLLLLVSAQLQDPLVYTDSAIVPLQRVMVPRYMSVV